MESLRPAVMDKSEVTESTSVTNTEDAEVYPQVCLRFSVSVAPGCWFYLLHGGGPMTGGRQVRRIHSVRTMSHSSTGFANMGAKLTSAVKVDVSEVSVVSDYKVLVVSHESTARDVIHSLLKKLRMKEEQSRAFVIQAELFSHKEIAVLQFEENDKVMHAYSHFPKGSLSFYLRRKMETSEKIMKDADKASLNGHQLTIQRIRRSLEKLKRKSSAVSADKQAGGQKGGGRDPGRGARGVESRPARESAENSGANDQNAHLIKADEFYKEPRREHRGRQGHPRKHHSDVSTPRSDNRRLVSSESVHGDGRHGKSGGQAAHSLRSESMYQLQQGSAYKTSTLPQGGTMVSMETDCMIFYDNTSDAGSVHSMPVPASHHNHPARAHVMPHLNHKSDFNLNSVMIDKPQKTSFRNLEDSGIDVKSPPQVGSTQRLGTHSEQNGERTPQSSRVKKKPGKITTCDVEVSQAMNSQNSFLSPTLSESSPFSLSDGHVKRSDSFSSMKSLPVAIYKDNSTPNSFTFETIDHRDELRSKSQSCTNLSRNKVVRRRSLPPLDVSQEKLEQKKTSLSKRLARKINRYRENEKRFPGLPSPHAFTPQPMSKEQPKDPDELSLADMEVAHILEGKPEHPTDSDVEDYLACVESAEPATQPKSGQGKTSGTSQQGKSHKDTAPAPVESDPMEQSGYYRYRNSAKLERQQKQESAEPGHSDHQKNEKVTENPDNPKPESLNKFVDQSMKSFLHHCHDVNMVSKHDTLELHQAALHSVLPTSPSAKTYSSSRTTSTQSLTKTPGYHSPVKESHSTTKVPGYHSPVKVSGSHSLKKSSGNTARPAHLRTLPVDSQNYTKTAQSSCKTPLADSPSKTPLSPMLHSPTKTLSAKSSTKSSSVKSPTKCFPSTSPTKLYLAKSPTKSLSQSPTKSSCLLSPTNSFAVLSPREMEEHGHARRTTLHSPSTPHNSTKATGFNSSSQKPLHPPHSTAQSATPLKSSSKADDHRSAASMLQSSVIDRGEVPSKVSVDNSGIKGTAGQHVMAEQLDVVNTRSKMYELDTTSDFVSTELHDKDHPHWQSPDVTDGRAHVHSENISINCDQDTVKTSSNAFTSRANTGQHELTKHNRTGQVVSVPSVSKQVNQRHKQPGSSVSHSGELAHVTEHTADAMQGKAHRLQNSASKYQLKSQPQSPGGLNSTNSDAILCSKQLFNDIDGLQAIHSDSVTGSKPLFTNIDPRGNGEVKDFDTASNSTGGSSQRRSQSSRHPPQPAGDGEGTVSKSLSLFSLALSHTFCSVYLEKSVTAGGYGLSVGRGEFRMGRQAWQEADGEPSVYSVVQLTEIHPQSPAHACKGKLLPGDIIVEVNGHSVLPSSHRVVHTLLEARSHLELVVARPRHGDQPHTADILNLTFDNMEQLPAELTGSVPQAGETESDRYWAYQTTANVEQLPTEITGHQPHSGEDKSDRYRAYQTTANAEQLPAEITGHQPHSGEDKLDRYRAYQTTGGDTARYTTEGATFLL